MKKRPAAFRAAIRRTLVFAFVCWFCAMFLLTWAVAADMDIQVQHCFTQDVVWGSAERASFIEYDTDLPGVMEANTRINIPTLYERIYIEPLLPIVIDQRMGNGISSEDWIWGKWNLYYGAEPAVIFTDENEEIFAKSGSFMTFFYSDKPNSWITEGCAYIDVGALDGNNDWFKQHFTELPFGALLSSDFYYRMTGHFDGNIFYPVIIDSRWKSSSQWNNVYTAQNTSDELQQTIYVWDAHGYYQKEVPVFVDGQRFASLTEYLETARKSEEEYERSNLFRTILIYNVTRTDSYGEYNVSYAVRYYPVFYAMFRLLAVYLVSLAAAAVWAVLYLRKLRKSLIDPIVYIAYAIDHGTTLKPSAKWEELYTLETYFADSRTYASETTTQLQQLRTALDYAHNAEENRRKLVSDITHELKTPLAVIHSYTECLQENVAPEKREQYLSVILEETRHMDAMVLQMLDLSRLEAGKVRLASDTVALEQLTRQIVERFTIMIEEKQLRLHWVVPTETLITADEGRISQAVTNLVSNAVKYTPVGGEIIVKIFAKDRTVHFYISNTAKPLSEEVMEKVWDSFYRADSSRTEPGTGLGLALVKSIIQLHGGQCFVRNTSTRYETKTETGVEFGFTIPLP